MRAYPAVANRAIHYPPFDRVISWLALALAAVFATGCPNHVTDTQRAKPRVRVRSFTEATGVRQLVSVPPYVFAATGDGLDRWEPATGQVVRIRPENGLPGALVQDLAYDATDGELWIATDVGLTRYAVADQAFRDLPPPPEILGVESFDDAVITPAGDGAAWVGLPRGMFQVSREGEWAPTGITAAVNDLLVDKDGALWIATAVGLFVSQDGVATPLGAESGCDLASIRFLVQGPDERPIAVGKNAAGRQRIAIATPTGCHSYQASPNQVWRAATHRPGEVVVLSNRRLYIMALPSLFGRTLSRDGMQLLPVPRSDGERPAPSPFVLRALPGRVPAGSQTLAATDSELLVGTRHLGTARMAVRGRRDVSWLRHSELVAGATTLSVACAKRDDCYIATGSPSAWRFDGSAFEVTGGGQRRVLAVVRSSEGRIIGVRQTDDGSRMELADVADGEWRDLGVFIDAPGSDPELNFARFSPSDLLWLGLRYRDDAGEYRPHGVALVDVALGVVAYHHASRDEQSTEKGILPIPIGVTGVSFIDENEAWLSTHQGATQVVGDKVTVWTEAEGLQSEFLRGVACHSGGMVYVAAGQGIDAFDGMRWTPPPALDLATNDIDIGRDGRLWLAADRGLGVYDGDRLRYLDARRGLVENRILDVAIDRYGRVWLRGEQSLGLVTP